MPSSASKTIQIASGAPNSARKNGVLYSSKDYGIGNNGSLNGGNDTKTFSRPPKQPEKAIVSLASRH